MKQNNTRKPSKRLRQKLLIYFLGFSAIILGTLWLMQTVLLDDMYRAIKTVGIERSADFISEHINDENIISLLDEMHEKNDMRIEVYDTSNSMNFYLLYSSREQGNLGLDYYPHQLYSYYSNTKLRGGEGLFLRKLSLTLMKTTEKILNYQKPSGRVPLTLPACGLLKTVTKSLW